MRANRVPISRESMTVADLSAAVLEQRMTLEDAYSVMRERQGRTGSIDLKEQSPASEAPIASGEVSR